MHMKKNALGLGLRPIHYQDLLEHEPIQELDYLEIISENFLSNSHFAQQNMQKAIERYPIVLHGLGMNLLGPDPLDTAYLDQIADLAELTNAPFVTDHLCWCKRGNLYHHDLLPAPYTLELAEYAAERAAKVQDWIGRPFGIENLSSYIAFEESVMNEWEFYNYVVQKSTTLYMLDINNVYVSSINHAFDPYTYLDSIDWQKICQVHIAGHEIQANGMIVDTHAEAVCKEVWELYKQAWKSSGGFPTLLEWDDNIPEIQVCLKELQYAKTIQESI